MRTKQARWAHVANALKGTCRQLWLIGLVGPILAHGSQRPMAEMYKRMWCSRTFQKVQQFQSTKFAASQAMTSCRQEYALDA